MRYFARKGAMFLLTLWAAVTLNFVIPRLMPGSPVQATLARLAAGGQTVTEATKRAIEIQLGLPHSSLWVQYRDYLVNISQLRFGMTYSITDESVAHAILSAAPWTLVLVGTSTVIAFVIGTLLGVYAGWRRQSRVDSVVTVGSTFFSAFPPFFLGLLLLYFLGFKYHLFPLTGGYTPGAAPQLTFSFLGDAVYHSILPAVTLVVTSLAGWVLGMRNNMINTLGEDYVLFAEANGLRDRTIALLYVARNALLPNVTGFGLALGAVIGGSVLVESIFGYPGIGSLLLLAVDNRDYPLMQAIFLLITVSMLVTIFLVDLLYGWLDPRVREV
ncbi:ABC transporter permease [Ferrimicrobium sp.]|uniref:ABC transporter permease n=1 Tax=Ferrimicrobium sp. TaxID=2926050 RepID=UPI002627CE50|nr:ABC transporter permease [Ferrimicrobium sp.]